MNRRILLSAALAVAAGSATVAHQPAAQAACPGAPRYFVVQSTGLFEVITGSAGGGTFIRRPTGEVICVPGLGARQVMGYTDRAKRGESLVTVIPGSGLAQEVGVKSARGNLGFIRPAALPAVLTWTVSTNPADDNVYFYAIQGVYVDRRLPIGTR